MQVVKWRVKYIPRDYDDPKLNSVHLQRVGGRPPNSGTVNDVVKARSPPNTVNKAKCYITTRPRPIGLHTSFRN